MKRTLFAPELGKMITCTCIGKMSDGSGVWEREDEEDYQFVCYRIWTPDEGYKQRFYISAEK